MMLGRWKPFPTAEFLRAILTALLSACSGVSKLGGRPWSCALSAGVGVLHSSCFQSRDPRSYAAGGKRRWSA